MCHGQGSVELAGDVPLERAHDLFGGASFGAASGNIGAGWSMSAHPNDDDGGQCPVESAVSAAIQPVPRSVSRGCRYWTGAGERSERRLGPDPPRMGPRRQDTCGDDRAHAGQLAQLKSNILDEGIEALTIVDEFAVEGDDALGQPDRFLPAGGDD